MTTYDFRGCIIGLLCLAALVYLVSLLILPAPAQNMSQMGRAPWYKAKRERAINACMKLPDIRDVQVCVEAIK